jgi:hypothetical protein
MLVGPEGEGECHGRHEHDGAHRRHGTLQSAFPPIVIGW